MNMRDRMNWDRHTKDRARRQHYQSGFDTPKGPTRAEAQKMLEEAARNTEEEQRNALHGRS
jgi:hypothetical protein